MLPIERTRSFVALLRNAGYAVVYREFNGGHEFHPGLRCRHDVGRRDFQDETIRRRALSLVGSGARDSAMPNELKSGCHITNR